MKYSIIAFLLVIGSYCNAFAEPADCKDFETLARKVMDGRLSGVSMSDVMAIKGSESFKFIVIEAYESPKYSSEQRKKEAIDEFGNSIYLRCVKSRAK
jgi:hypothetical protein